MKKQTAMDTIGKEVPSGQAQVAPGEMGVPPTVKPPVGAAPPKQMLGKALPGLKKKKKITSIAQLREVGKAKFPGKM